MAKMIAPKIPNLMPRMTQSTEVLRGFVIQGQDEERFQLYKHIKKKLGAEPINWEICKEKED